MKHALLSVLLSPEEIETIASSMYTDEMPLWTYWGEFVEKYLRTGKSEITIRRVKDTLIFAIRRLGFCTIESLNNHKVLEDGLHAYKERVHISNTTFNTYLKNLNTYFRWLHKHDYILTNNLTRIDRCKEDINEQYTISEDNVKALVTHVHDRQQTRLQRLRNVFFFDLLRFTGARPCELLNIQMRDVTRYGNTYKLVIRGRKQKGRPRYYPLSSAVRDSYESYVQHRFTLRKNEPFLFISSSKQGRWTEKGMRGLFKRLSHELGFRVIAYGFRRYVATKLHSAGMDMKDIGYYLGHSRASTTQRYIERSCALTAKGAEVMGQ